MIVLKEKVGGYSVFDYMKKALLKWLMVSNKTSNKVYRLCLFPGVVRSDLRAHNCERKEDPRWKFTSGE